MSKERRVAFVTGATTGIGREIALTLAEAGFDVSINCLREPSEFEDLKNEVQNFGARCHFTKGDVSKFEDAQRMVEEVMTEYGRIDVLVNNAGITRDTLLMRMKKEDFESVINVNLIGTFNVTKCAIPYMMKQRYGRIISMASVVGISGNAGQVNYAASKAGIIGFTKSIAKELRK